MHKPRHCCIVTFKQQKKSTTPITRNNFTDTCLIHVLFQCSKHHNKDLNCKKYESPVFQKTYLKRYIYLISDQNSPVLHLNQPNKHNYLCQSALKNQNNEFSINTHHFTFFSFFVFVKTMFILI